MGVGLADTYRISSRYTDDEGTVFMTGLQALARLPIEQLRADRLRGLRTAAYISGYPGSPLGGYDGAVDRAIREAPELPIVHQPAVNEEYAATAVMGSQLASTRPDPRYDGVVGIWYGKGPGVDRASDAIRHGVFAGSDPRGGAVVLAGDDPNAKSSTIPSSSAGSLADMHIPVIYPGDAGEALDLGRHAIALSRMSGLWTSLKIVADVADGSGTVHLHPERIEPVMPTIDGQPYRHRADGRLLTPHTIDIEREIYEIRYALAVEYAAQNQLNHTTVDPTDAWIGIVSSGITHREVRAALRRLGLESDRQIEAAGIRLLCMHMPIPFSPVTMRDFARGVDEVFVIEEKHPNIESLLKDALYNQSHHPRVVGKTDENDEKLLAGHGSLTADDLIPALRRRLSPRLGDRLAPAPPAPRERIPLGVSRTPFYCSGCPHNRSTQVPDGALVGAGIGCHTMAMLMDPDRIGDIAGLTCMGNEGLQWAGMEPFVETDHLFQNLGDGTYFHSGQLAVQAAVAAGAHVTYKLLWNGAVAMTGGQQAQGRIPLPNVVRVLLAQGVTRVIVTTDDLDRYRTVELPGGVEVWPRQRLIEAQELLADIEGVTVLIHDQACAAETRRARKRGLAAVPDRRVVINDRLCEGCGDCAQKSNCLSVHPVETPFGRKTTIDQTSCNLDFTCLEGDCPAFMAVVAPSRRRPWRRRRPDSPGATPARPSPPDMPEPALVVDPDDVSLRVTGIGGTGVVTVSQVIGTAAMFDGLEVRGLDQIGLSQKAGPVVSDIRLTRRSPADTSRLGAAQADVIMAFDQLVAASPSGLDTARAGHTMVVGSTTATPTGAMITHPEVAMPSGEELGRRIATVTREGHRHWADAGAITTRLFGDSVTANIFVVGMAVQAGQLPVSAESVEQAIALNGVAVERNIEAFRWGRCRIADPDALNDVLDDHQVAPPPALPREIRAKLDDIADGSRDLRSGLERFAADLVGYQNARTALDYLDAVAEVGSREQAVSPGSTRLTAAVARNLHKLVAYKDEYEVARLMLDPEAIRPARELASTTGGRVVWQLHPPILRAMGRRSKMSFGGWSTPMFRVLTRMRWLRGRALDPFGHTSLRRAERALPDEYRLALASALDHLTVDNLDAVVALADLPDLVRGYEDLKVERIAEFRARLRAAVDAID
ncbi:MAG: indolepyruvate ferredoxin oxidoreductase family protein [Acidimicrobiales bacterium]